MTHLQEIHGDGSGRKLSSGKLSISSTFSSSSSSSPSSSLMEFKSSTCSSSVSSLPSHFTSTSSVDSALIWLYTSCEFKNLPHKPLSSARTNSGISSLCLAPDGSLIAGTASSGIQLFANLSNLKEFHIRNMNSPSSSASGSVKAVMSSHGHIFTSHQDGSISLRSDPAQELKVKGSLPTKSDTLSRFLFPGNYVKVRRHRKVLWIRHADAVSSLASSESFIYSASWDKTLKIWRAADLRCLQSIRAHEDAVNAVAAHEQFVYTAAADGKIKAWEVSGSTKGRRLTSRRKMLTLVAVLERHSSSVNALVLDTISGYLYSASSDKTIGVWEREETAMHMAAVDSLRGHCMAVLSLAMCNVGGGEDKAKPFLLCSGSADKTVRVWSRERRTGVHSCLCVIRGHEGPVKAVGISAGGLGEGALVWSGGLDSHVRTWLVSLEEDVEESKRVEA